MENSTADTPVKYAGENGLQASGAQAVEQQRAIAEVQGAIISAKKFPRDVVGAIERIKVACQRPTLAAQALYSYGKGGSEVTGPSIRLMEAVAQNYGNISCGVIELARANGSSECLAYAWDMETNFRDEKKFTVRHWRDTKSGGYPLKDERDIYELIANMGARRKRACLMAVIPGDVVEDAATQCDETLRAKVQITPERIKSMAEAFAAFSVTSEQLEKRIQRKLSHHVRLHLCIRGGCQAGASQGSHTAVPARPVRPRSRIGGVEERGEGLALPQRLARLRARHRRIVRLAPTLPARR